MTATFAQIPIMGGTYTSSANKLPILIPLGLTINMGSSGSHHIQIKEDGYDGYYRIGANVQITGTIGSQSVFYLEQNSTLINQYFVDILGNMLVSFETVIYAVGGDQISLYLTV